MFHGRAINLQEDDDRLPFHATFLFHEMRARGYWPLCGDRAIPLPIPWVDWMNRSDGGRGHGGHGGSGHHLRSHGSVPSAPEMFIPTNLFENHSKLQQLKDSFAKQPNWEAAVKEGENNAD